MTATASAAPRGALAEDQRLSATLALSLLVHALVLLGIGFTLEDAAPLRPTLDVILTETADTQAPADETDSADEADSSDATDSSDEADEADGSGDDDQN